MSDERRVVTVLFADVAGSTGLGETLDPEDLRALLARYYAIAKEVVAAHGGTVEKFIGDAVMAVFGLRRAHGDDAVRAVSAALELRDRVRSDPRLGDRMPIRLGVNTGDVIASRDEGSDDFLVTGDPVNVAARLQQVAPTWTILVGERTARAARSEFRFGRSESIEAKGRNAAVTASEVLGRAHAISNRTPIYGRESDLAQLELVARRAFDEARPYMVSVIAPAGTGKTRLLEEFLARLPQIDDDARVAVAQCLPYGQRLTYWPLRAVLFRLVGIDEDASAEQVRASIDAWLADNQVEDAPKVGALLASTLGAGETETTDRAALFAAWRTFIEVASRRAPLVVAVEDLHWSSDTLLDLFEYVLQPRGGTRSLLIAIARPELLDRRPAWGGGRRNHSSIALEPLDDAATSKLVATLAEGAPQALVDAVVARAEGNPFFAGEIVRALIEDVRSFSDPTALEAAVARLPDTVQATVLARLDSLPAEERETLRVGSVFGRSFRPIAVAALHEVSGRPPDEDIDLLCERLAERDLIRPSGADGYTFRHILIREVAYSTLPRATRALLHGAAGRWLEERSVGREEAVAELVALHFREAATLAGTLDLDDTAELRRSAHQWLVRAADVARSAAASVEAREHVRAAVEFAEPADLPRLYEMLGDVEIGGQQILAAYSRALELSAGDSASVEARLRILAKMLMVETRSQGAVASRPSREDLLELRAEGRRLMEVVTDPRTRARFLAADAFWPFWVSAAGGDPSAEELAAAERDASEALVLARDLEDYNLQSAALDALGSIAGAHFEWAEQRQLADQRIAMGPRLAMVERIDAYSVAAWSAFIEGDLQAAERLSGSGLAILQPGQAPEWTLHLLAWRADTLLLTGDWDELESIMDRSCRLWVDAGRPAAGYAMRGFVAGLIVAHARRNGSLAERIAQVIEDVNAQFTPPRPLLAQFLRWDPKAMGDELRPAMVPATTFENLAMGMGMCSDANQRLDHEFLVAALAESERTKSSLGRAEVLRAIGIANVDTESLAAAHADFYAHGAAPYAARTAAELAILTGDRARLDTAISYLESIRDDTQVQRYLAAARDARL